MDLTSGLPVRTRLLGADYYGIADLVPAWGFIHSQGGERIARYPRAVVMGIVLLDTLVDLLPEREDPAAAILYRHHSYDVVDLALDQIGLQIANAIQREGYQALPVPASKRSSDELIAGVFSQKLAAHRAGLGWIGRSCLLITPDHGPRVRWIAVLTDAPLVPTGTPMESRCDVWISVRSMHLPAVHSGRMSRGRHDSMPLSATVISGTWKRAGARGSAGCACISARTGG
jgi:epoxyqueuosine reductase